MQAFLSLTFGLLVAEILLLVPGTSASRGPNKLQRDTPDSFKIFGFYDEAWGVKDIDDDSKLDCLSARREDYDPSAKSVTYVWSIADSNGGGRKKVPFHFTEGESPDTVKFTVDSDGEENSGVAKMLYTDYENCTVMQINHFGDECILWATERVKDDIPKYCLEQFADICGNGVTLRDADKCKDV